MNEHYQKTAQALDYAKVTVDPVEFTFQGLSERTAMELRQITDAIVLQGTIPEDNYLVNLWREVYNDSRLGLLTLSTVFPIRAYLSLLRYQDSQR